MEITRPRPFFGPGGNSKSFYDEGFKHSEEAPAWVKARGLDAYEYQCGNGVTGTEATFKKIGIRARETGISLSLHAPYFISLSGTDPETRLKSLGYIEKSRNAALAMGADTIVIHTGSAGKISREEALALAADTLSRALDALGDLPVRYGLETMGKKNQLGTLDEVIALCKADPRLVPVVDFGHLNARECGNAFRSADDYRRVFDKIGEGLDDCRARYLHCHFSKIEYTDAGEKRHLTFSDTVYGPDYEPLMEAIAKESLCPRVISESAGTMAEDALTMKTFLEGLSAAKR